MKLLLLVCAVALVGCHKEPVKSNLTFTTNWYDFHACVATISNKTTGEWTNLYMTNILYEPSYWPNPSTNRGMKVVLHLKDGDLKFTDFDPMEVGIESTHKPTLSHSNNVWIIRFEP